MTSIFIFISGATLLVYSAERLIGSLVGVSRGLRISVFLLAIVFTGIEFDDIVLGVALNLEDEQDVALGLVLGTAVSFTGIVLALGAIFTPTRFDIPRDYIAIFAVAPLVMLVFALQETVDSADAVVLLVLFVAFVGYIAVQGAPAGDGDVPQPRDRRGTDGGRRGRRGRPPLRPCASAVEGHLDDEPVQRPRPVLGLAQRRRGRAGARRDHHRRRHGERGDRARSSTATRSKARCSAPPSSPPC